MRFDFISLGIKSGKRDDKNASRGAERHESEMSEVNFEWEAIKKKGAEEVGTR
jgi:hypothetical protein